MGLGKKNVIFMKTIQGFIAFWKKALHIYICIYIYIYIYIYKERERERERDDTASIIYSTTKKKRGHHNPYTN